MNSFEPVTVLVAAWSTSSFANVAPDSYLVRPVSDSSLEYFLATHGISDE